MLNQTQINPLFQKDFVNIRTLEVYATKVLMQGKLIAVTYTLRSYLNQFSLGELF